MSFVPKYVARTEAKQTRDVVTADQWNELFNLLIAQGDHNSKTLDDLINKGLYPVPGEVGPVGPIGPVGPVGPQGPKGDPGTSFTVLGLVALVGDLPATGNTVGDAYAVGDASSNVIYVWDGAAWDNLGSLQGPAGATGAPGATGPAGPGLPAAGAVGQLIRKKSATNYDTEWFTPAYAASVHTHAISDVTNLQASLDGKLGSTATAVNATKWNGRQVFVSATAPTSGMVSGDIWFKPAS